MRRVRSERRAGIVDDDCVVVMAVKAEMAAADVRALTLYGALTVFKS